jgi:plasmid replication initiation protein
MTSYRLVLQEVVGADVFTSYTSWLESVEMKEGADPEVYVAFNSRFERIWLESKKHLPDYMEQKPANTELRSKYALRLYSWAKKHGKDGTVCISLEDLRSILDLQSAKDANGNVIHEAPMPVWANFRQRALDVAILEISAKTDLKIKLVSIERSKHRRVVALDFAIKSQAIPKVRTNR